MTEESVAKQLDLLLSNTSYSLVIKIVINNNSDLKETVRGTRICRLSVLLYPV